MKLITVLGTAAGYVIAGRLENRGAAVSRDLKGDTL